MSRVKARYVAQVEIDVDVERTEDTKPLEQVKDSFRNDVTGALQAIIENGMGDCKVTVTQQYADAWEVQDDE